MLTCVPDSNGQVNAKDHNRNGRKFSSTKSSRNDLMTSSLLIAFVNLCNVDHQKLRLVLHIAQGSSLPHMLGVLIWKTVNCNWEDDELNFTPFIVANILVARLYFAN